MDDGFIFKPLYRSFHHIKTSLSNMNSSKTFIFHKAKLIYRKKGTIVLNFLDIKVILQKGNSIQTDIYYK